MPRRHAVFAHHFGDHLGPAGGFLVVLQSKWADLPRSMTLNAVILKDARHLLAVSDFTLVGNWAHTPDQAANRVGFGLAHFLAGQ